MKSRSWLVGLLTAPVVAACGSTVPQPGPGAGPAGGGLSAGSPAPAASRSGAVTGPAGDTAAAATVTSPASGHASDLVATDLSATSTAGTRTASPTRASRSVTRASRSSAAHSGPASGPGFTPTQVYLGVEYTNDFEQVSAGLGSATSSGDDRALAEAVIADINKAGGLLGRTVEPIFHNTSAVGAASDANTAAQATCADFATDHRVAAALVFTTAWTCLAQAKVPTVLVGAMQPTDTPYLQALEPYFYDPAIFSMTDFTPLFLDRLTAQGYFPRGAKVGVFYGNQLTEPRDAQALIAQLKSRQIEVAATFEYDASNSSSVANSGTSAVLTFRGAGVDHVIGLDANIVFEMIGAEQQQYRPRYAISSYLLPQPTLAANAPPAQLADAVGVGWQPVTDTGQSKDVAGVGPGVAACRRSITDSGQNFEAMALARFVAFTYCDAIHLIVDGATAARGLTPAMIRSGVASLGASFRTALNLRSAYSTTRTDGAAAVRDLAYETSCSCFAYRGAQLYPAG
jgi:hypothetical protein